MGATFIEHLLGVRQRAGGFTYTVSLNPDIDSMKVFPEDLFYALDKKQNKNLRFREVKKIVHGFTAGKGCKLRAVKRQRRWFLLLLQCPSIDRHQFTN